MAIEGLRRGAVFSDTSDVIFAPRFDTFSLSSDLDVTDVNGFSFDGDGRLQIVDTTKGVETYSLTLSNASFDSQDWSRLLEQKISSTTFTAPTTLEDVVPATPFQVTVTGLTVDQPVQIIFDNDTENAEQGTQVTVAPAAAGEYQVTANTITFFSADESRRVSGVYKESQTGKKSIGADTSQSQITGMEFYGIITSPRRLSGWEMYCPSIVRTGGISASPGESSPVEYRPVKVPGYALPVIIYNL